MLERLPLCLVLLAGCAGSSASHPSDGGAERDADTVVDGGSAVRGIASTCAEGVRFCNQAGPLGLHEDEPAYGRGAAMIDFDGDGLEDLWQSDSGVQLPTHAGTSRMYRNLGSGRFEVVDLGIPDTHLTSNWAGIFGDYDNDGDPDLFLVNGGYFGVAHAYLYRNDYDTDGRFTEVTSAAGLSTEAHAWWGATFGDLDGDGWPELVVQGNWLMADGAPNRDDSLRVYRNLRNGQFEEVSDAWGLPNPRGDSHNPVLFDADGDGDLDLYLSGLSPHDTLEVWSAAVGLHLNDEGTFTHQPLAFGDFADNGNAGFAVAADDFDQDGLEDLYVGRMFEQDYLLLSRGDGTFQALGRDAGLEMRLGMPTVVLGEVSDGEENTMGLTVGDLDADGFPDVVIGPGSPYSIGEPLVLCHDGESPVHFSACSDDFVAGHEPGRHHGVALGDIDHDGDVDLFWNLGGAAFVDILDIGYHSSQLSAFYVQHPPSTPQTASVRLRGTASGREAIGAHLIVHGARTHHVFVHSSQGFQSHSSAWNQLVLGQASARVEVLWPSGARTQHDIRVGERVTWTEPAGQRRADRRSMP